MEDGNKSIISKFFIAFLGGLIAIITPCVFPMIPMTVAFSLRVIHKIEKKLSSQGYFLDYQ